SALFAADPILENPVARAADSDPQTETENVVVEYDDFILAGRHRDFGDVDLSEFHRMAFLSNGGESCSLRPHYVRGAERTWTRQKAGKRMGSNAERFRAVSCFPKSGTFIVFSEICKRPAAYCGLIMWCQRTYANSCRGNSTVSAPDRPAAL